MTEANKTPVELIYRNRDLYREEGLHYATPFSAGVDLRIDLTEVDRYKSNEEFLLLPSECFTFDTGVSIFINDPNYVLQLYPRSGAGCKQGLMLGNAVGNIDADYQGKIRVCLWNRGEELIALKHGERVAQAILQPITQMQFNIVEEFSDITIRGDGGFGHSGKN